MKKVPVSLKNKTILVTGSPGFIGANLVLRLLKEMNDGTIISFDSMSDYFNPELNKYRLSLIERVAAANTATGSKVKHIFIKGNLADKALIEDIFAKYKPAIVVNLAAQAGVRYSIDHPDAYIGTLSFRQRKREALADALLLRPRFLLLDDLLAGLDPATRFSFGRILAAISSFAAIIVSGHEIDELASWATKFYVLQSGHVLGAKTASGVKNLLGLAPRPEGGAA